MSREKRYLMFSIALAVVALGVLAAGIAAQSGIDWSQSSVTPSATCVEPSGLVTFTVQVVNSSTVTAEDILISNKIPDGTEFVSVTEGMLIMTSTGSAANTEAFITGMAETGGEPALDPKTVPPGGFLLDHTGGSLDDIDPADVTHVTWIGDIGPGAENMVAFDLVLEVKAGDGDTVTNTVDVVDDYRLTHQETASVEITEGEPPESTVIYIPLVIGGAGDSDPEPPPPVVPPLTQTKIVTAPLTRIYEAASKADTITEALRGEGSIYRYTLHPTGDNADVGINFREYYGDTRITVKRGIFIFDVPEAVWGRRVLTVQLTIGADFALGETNVPAIVSRASPSVLDPHDSVSAEDIYFGHEGEPWEWHVPFYVPGSHFAPIVTLSLPADRLNWAEDETAIHLRCGVEERPDLWEDDAFYRHLFQWHDEYYIPTLELSITNTVTSSVTSSVDLHRD
jgi:uncharacterized repeat protein (TIGR01451 family)